MTSKFDGTSDTVWKPSADKHIDPPQPLFRELSAPKPFPLGALGPVLSSAGEAIDGAIQAPSALSGQSLLGAAALAVQSHGDIYIDGRVRPLSLFLLTVGQSGERKSAVDAEVLKPHRAVEREKIEQQEKEQREFERESEAWDIAKNNALKGGIKRSQSEIANAIFQLGARPQPPLSEIMLMDEPTLEGMQKALAFGRPSIGIFSDEGGRMVGGHGMSADNQLKTAAGICLLWDGSPMSRVRAGDGSTKLFGKRLSMHLMFQHRVAEQLTSNQVLLDQGLLSRCLIAAPESTVGKRSYRNIDLNENSSIIRYRKVMKEILDMPLPFVEGKKNELNPRQIPLANDAKNLWIIFHNHVEERMKEGREFHAIRGFASKAAEHTLRIAGVLTLIENIESREVTHEQLQSAIALVEFYLSEALRLYDGSVLNPELVQASKLLEWCQKHSVVYPTLIYQRGPNVFRDKAVATKHLRILEEHNWLKKIDGGLTVDGKSHRDVWEVVK